MGKLHEEYRCHCQASSPKIHLSEDTGLCNACNGVYDERLYEMRLRQHVPDWHYDDLDSFLLETDEYYRSLVNGSKGLPI